MNIEYQAVNLLICRACLLNFSAGWLVGLLIKFYHNNFSFYNKFTREVDLERRIWIYEGKLL